MNVTADYGGVDHALGAGSRDENASGAVAFDVVLHLVCPAQPQLVALWRRRP